MAAERLLIWGAGGHGRVVADLARAAGHEVVGFCDRTVVAGAEDAVGVRVISEDELLGRLRPGGDLPEGATAVVPAVGLNETRLSMVEALGPRLARPLVHPMASVSPTAALGHGSVVMAGAVLNAGARLGRAAIINSAAVVEHDCVLADGVHVSPGAVLAGAVQVGRCAWVGAGAVVIEGRRVGAGAVVGAGAAVVRDVPDGETVVGVPARRRR